MARVPYFDPAQAPERAKAFLAKLPPLNIFRMMGHIGAPIESIVRLGDQILAHGALDPILREIAVIRVGVLSGARYEIYQHEHIARGLGMSHAQLSAIAEGPDAAVWNEMERLILRFTDDLVLNVRACDQTFEPLRARLSLQQLQELVITIGFYMMISRFLETFDVDLDPEGPGGGVKLPGMSG